MRFPLARLAGAAAGVLIVLSCDGGPAQPRFGSGISGGPTGTAPVVPPDPSIPDTGEVRTFIQIPANDGDQVNIGEPILVRTLITDDRNVAGLTIVGMKFVGDPDLGTLQEIVRYTAIPVPAPGAPPLRAGITDTTVSRFLTPNVPVDSTVGELVILAIGRDAAGNVDTARRVLQLVTGPSVTITGPDPAFPVTRGFTMEVTARVIDDQGVSRVDMLIEGDASFSPPLSQPFTDIIALPFPSHIVGTQRDLTITHGVAIPADAPIGGTITIRVSAEDANGNPGSAPDLVVTVQAAGSTAPRVIQEVPERMELSDSVKVTAIGDGIQTLGVIVRDADTDAIIVDRMCPPSCSLPLTGPPFSSAPAPRYILLNLPVSAQGQDVEVLSYAIDQAGATGYSIASPSQAAQTVAGLAHISESLVVFGLTYPLPRAGVVGDIAVDVPRSHVLLSNLTSNRLEVWENGPKTFDPNGVAVGSQPWGLSASVDPNVLLVGNSGGTNISRVNLGTGTVASIQELLQQRILTRTNFMFTITEAFDIAGFVRYGAGFRRHMFSDRPQYIGQTSDSIIYFSTRPTTEAPEGTVRYVDPRQPFPDLRTFVFVRANAIIDNFVLVDIDSITTRSTPAGFSDQLLLWDHLPGTNLPSNFVRSPSCRHPNLAPLAGTQTCAASLDADGNPTDPRFDPRYPEGIPQGVLAAVKALRTNQRCLPRDPNPAIACPLDPVTLTPILGTPIHPCAVFDPVENPLFPSHAGDPGPSFGKCSDVRVIEDVDPTGVTDTTFVGASPDRNWIAFGEGNSPVGNLMMAQANPCTAACPTTLHPLRPLFPQFFSPIVTQEDLTNQASERIFGLAIDRTGRTISAHGSQSYFSEVGNPFHLRLQGVFGDAGTGGAGIAYHPLADGGSPIPCVFPCNERVSFIAAGDRTVHAVDIAFYVSRGRYELKHQLYGPLRVTLPMPGDDPTVILKLYGISLTGGLTVIDLRQNDIRAVP